MLALRRTRLVLCALRAYAFQTDVTFFPELNAQRVILMCARAASIISLDLNYPN